MNVIWNAVHVLHDNIKLYKIINKYKQGYMYGTVKTYKVKYELQLTNYTMITETKIVVLYEQKCIYR